MWKEEIKCKGEEGKEQVMGVIEEKGKKGENEEEKRGKEGGKKGKEGK